MRMFSLLAVVCSFLFAQDYSIQVMALQDEKNLTQELLKKVQNLGKCEVVKEGGYTKLRVGNYEDYADASAKLKDIRSYFTRDAFLVEERPSCKVTKNIMVEPKSNLPEEIIVVDNAVNPCKIELKEIVKRDSRKSRRQSEIAEAMEYYANSQYYTFGEF